MTRRAAENRARAERLEVVLRTPLPSALEVGAGTALFLHGWALHGDRRITRLELTAAGASHRVIAHRMPSPRVAAELGADAGPEARHCNFWGILPLESGAPATIAIGVVAALDGGGRAEASLGTIEASPAPAERMTPPGLALGDRTVAICMATYDPPAELLERQLASLRAQTHGDWVCLISDDASSPERFGHLEQIVATDPRFVVSRSSRRRGAYENFHRALAMVPREVPYVALCDQDDEWHPDKLAILLAALGDSKLVFSDMRIVDQSGGLIADTYWTSRQPNHTNFASLLLGNTVTGAASLFHRELLDDALPLPPRVGNLYHDHWLALVARATGTIEYVPRPLYDYVQHAEAVIGHAGANLGVVGGSILRRLAALRGRPRGRLRTSWRRIYFAEYCRMRLTARVLETRFGARIGGRERRTLRLIEAGEGAPAGIAWLTVRQLRRLRRDDTQGSEAAMLRAIAWFRAMSVRRRRGDPEDDTDPPI